MPLPRRGRGKSPASRRDASHKRSSGSGSGAVQLMFRLHGNGSDVVVPRHQPFPIQTIDGGAGGVVRNLPLAARHDTNDIGAYVKRREGWQPFGRVIEQMSVTV